MNNQVKLLLKGIRADVEAIANDRGADQRIQQWARDTFKAIGDVIDTPPVPTIKPLELVEIKSKPEYGRFMVEGLRAQIVPVATNKIVHRKILVDVDDLEVVE